MELLNNLALGFQTALTLQNLLYAFGGALLGTLIGVLPGLGRWPPSPCCCPASTRWTPPLR
jgi:TctA family transporter